MMAMRATLEIFFAFLPDTAPRPTKFQKGLRWYSCVNSVCDDRASAKFREPHTHSHTHTLTITARTRRRRAPLLIAILPSNFLAVVPPPPPPPPPLVPAPTPAPAPRRPRCPRARAASARCAAALSKPVSPGFSPCLRRSLTLGPTSPSSSTLHNINTQRHNTVVRRKASRNTYAYDAKHYATRTAAWGRIHRCRRRRLHTLPRASPPPVPDPTGPCLESTRLQHDAAASWRPSWP